MLKFRKIFICLICAAILFALIPHAGAEAQSDSGRYDPVADGIVSSYYSVDRETACISGIAPGTTIEQLQKVCMPADIVFSSETLATGTTLTVMEPGTDTVLHSLTAVVTGDLNGDGAVTITDMLMAKGKLLGQELTQAAQVAGDVNYDGNLTITDFLRLKAHLLGLEQIGAGQKADTQDPMLLLSPGASTAWDHGTQAASFATDNEAIATVAADGTVTAGTGEGSTYIYALNQDGNVIAKTVVTVLQEQLKVSLSSDKYGILQGKTLQLTAQFNHPVNVPVTWEIADTTIASVDSNGLVTAHVPGITQITVSTAGSTATAELTVIPPITDLETGKALYKVKPGHSRTIDLVIAPADVDEEFTWTSSNTDIVTVSQDGAVTGVAYGTATVTVTGRYSGLSASCDVKVCDVKQVAFTFDDGPGNPTDKLLDFLKENDIKVTFFLVGDRLKNYPNTVKRQVAEGHEIGYHSYEHKIQTGLSSAQITSDYEKSAKILDDLAGGKFTVWRTPGGGYNDRVLEAVPLPHILWSLDTRDWEVLNANKVYNNIMRYARDGSIILIHDLYNSSVNGAIMAMEEMMKGDYEFVTVTELLSRDGTPPEAGETYRQG